jgi:hypothetical protein
MNNWISVEDESPENGTLVIAYGRFQGEIDGLGELMIATGSFSGKIGEYSACIEMVADAYYAELVDVTHWMLLPEPPEEDKQTRTRIPTEVTRVRNVVTGETIEIK